MTPAAAIRAGPRSGRAKSARSSFPDSSSAGFELCHSCGPRDVGKGMKPEVGSHSGRRGTDTDPAQMAVEARMRGDTAELRLDPFPSDFLACHH